MNVVTTTKFKGFTIQVIDEISGYGFLATDDEGSAFGTPQQSGTAKLVYDTPEKAIAQAKRMITKFLNSLAYEGDE